jgi:hypothetical protein
LLDDLLDHERFHPAAIPPFAMPSPAYINSNLITTGTKKIFIFFLSIDSFPGLAYARIGQTEVDADGDRHIRPDPPPLFAGKPLAKRSDRRQTRLQRIDGHLLQSGPSSRCVVLWFSGVQVLVFLAGLQKEDRSLYEAARIDGASAWEAFWNVTLPELKPLVLVNVIYTIVFLSTFALNEVIVTIRNNMFSTFTGFGYAAAVAWLYFLLIGVVLLVWTALTGRQKN